MYKRQVHSLPPQHNGYVPRGTPPKFGPKVTHRLLILNDLSVGDIRSQIAAEWLQMAQRSRWRAYRKPSSLFSNGAIADLLRPSLPPKWGSICPQHTRMAISLQRVIRSTSCFWFYGGVFGDCGSNGAIYDSDKSKMAATAMLEKFQVEISLQPVVRSTSCLVIGCDFRGRQI